MQHGEGENEIIHPRQDGVPSPQRDGREVGISKQQIPHPQTRSGGQAKIDQG